MPANSIYSSRKNILLITCDQYAYPRFSYGPEGGFHEALKLILGFRGEADAAKNPYAKYFPGLMKLRANATVVLANHTIAASACTPSRTVIYTGQYGTRTGVTQTDGLFKSGSAPNFPWLAADGVPTLGTWMKEAGYSTHYFGKWHVSDPPDHSLKDYGFDDWESSYPEPHGAMANNLGVYRDVGFHRRRGLQCIRRRGLALDYDRVSANMQEHNPDYRGPTPDQPRPWFAVASFTNPHDIATYPAVIAQAIPPGEPPPTLTIPGGPTITLQNQSVFGPLNVPPVGTISTYPVMGTQQVPLNPLGFPQDCANPVPTQDETAHRHAVVRNMTMPTRWVSRWRRRPGSTWRSALPSGHIADKVKLAVQIGLQTCIPFQLTGDDAAAGCLQFLQLYAWLHSVVDPHIDAVLTALEQSGQAGKHHRHVPHRPRRICNRPTTA